MKYGFFDDIRKEYVITTPKTPLPWINYLGCKDFFSILSNTCGGYAFYKDAKLLRLTRYRYNNTPADSNGRYYYIKDGDTVWNPGWQPVKTPLDDYTCRHGLGYSRFISTKHNLKADLTMFVPLHDSCEIHRITLTNESNEVKQISIYSFIEFCLWNAMDDMTNFQRNLSTGEVEVEGSAIFHKTEYRERRNHYAVYSVNTPISGFDTDRDSFLGPYNGPDAPSAVLNGISGDSIASGWSPIGSHRIDDTFEPGQSRTYIFTLAYIENPEEEKWESPGVINKKRAYELLKQYQTPLQVDLALEQLKEYWDKKLATFSLESDDENLSRMINIWHPYQCMTTFNLSRSASYYESGIGRGMGFRDSCQDLLGFVHLIPERARERILDIAATQFEDGSTYHQYQPLTKKGNLDVGSGFNDDPLWLIACVCAYLKETGDFDILTEQVPFNNDSEKAKSLSEHLKRSFDYTINHLGPHGLPLIGRADWNDCLNLNCFSKEPGESFQTCANFESNQAESVFIAAMFIRYGKDYSELCNYLGLNDEACRAEEAVRTMTNAVLKYGWDGEWFLRAYDAFGTKVGSEECTEGKIFIEPQGFCVFAGIGLEDGFAEKALDSVHKYLETPYGIVLLQPAYQKYYLNLGEISSYPPGYKENAGIFCHNNPWISIAETMLGHGERAFDAYSRICPAYTEENSNIHRTEPYVYSQMIAGIDARNFGEAKNSWLTGTAAWAYVNASQYILGIRPSYDGLIVDPCIPKNLKQYTVTRLFRGVTYIIKIENPHGLEKGTISLTVDGTDIKGSIIPHCKDNYIVHVTAIIK